MIPTIWKRKPPSAIGPVYSARISAATEDPMGSMPLSTMVAAMRAAIARAVVASGLIPSLGVFHSNRSNPFCLADDLLGPYRPYVDWRVRLLVNETGGSPLSLNDRPIRAALLSLSNETVLVGGRRNPMLLAIQTSATSLSRAITGGDPELALPSGLPLGPDLPDGDGSV